MSKAAAATGNEAEGFSKGDATRNSTFIQARIVNKAISWCCKDSRPFDVLDDKGLRLLLKEMIAVGVKYGQVDIDAVLPTSATTVKIALTVTENLRNDQLQKLEHLFKASAVAASCEPCWEMASTKLLKSVYLHFINDNFQPVKYLLATVEVPFDNKLDDAVVAEKVFLKIGVDPSAVTLTSCANAGLSSPTLLRRLGCIKSGIDAIISAVLYDAKPLLLQRRISTCVKDAKQILHHAAQTGLTLDIENDKSGNSDFNVLKTVLRSYEKFKTEFDETGASSKLAGCPYQLIEILVKFLQPFNDVRCELVSLLKQPPNLHKSFPLLRRLHENCSMSSEDSSMLLMELKSFTRDLMDRNLPITIEHKVALFFDPRMKSLLILSHEDRSAVINKLEEQISQVDDGDLCEHNEIEQYQQLSIDANEVTDETLMTWWYGYQHQFPRLAMLARRYLAIPAAVISTSSFENKPAKSTSNTSSKVIDVMLYLKHALPDAEVDE